METKINNIYKMHSVHYTGYVSLLIQLITGIIDFYVLSLAIPPTFTLIRELLIMELIVQVIEFSFYVWMLIKINTINLLCNIRNCI